VTAPVRSLMNLITMRRIELLSAILIAFALTASLMGACGTKVISRQAQANNPVNERVLAKRNLERSMAVLDTATAHYFVGDGMAMGRYYNPFTGKLSEERGSVWMYTSAIEAVNAVLHALVAAKNSGDTAIYDLNFEKYNGLLSRLYDNADYYLGTFELTSFTQTKEWTVYAVDRVNRKGRANVTGVLNVYDDQMWLARELLESFRLTGKKKYLEKAEYLVEYVLDGWDTTLDEAGNEHGGIPWGPGYVSKHACSNGPIVSPLVWLHEIYGKSSEQIEHRFIDPDDRKTRRSAMRPKSEYYLEYAKKVYDWQKEHLLNEKGVYTDMMGGCSPCKIQYETVGSERYRANTPLERAVGQDYTYNSGTMLSGAGDLYRATKDNVYLNDGKALSDNSFKAFAYPDKDMPGYHSYHTGGFRNWFNGILLRGYMDMYPDYSQVDSYIATFQKNLDYGFDRFNHRGFLPTDLLNGWGKRDKDGEGVEGMFQFTFAANYAVLSRFEYEK